MKLFISIVTFALVSFLLFFIFLTDDEKVSKTQQNTIRNEKISKTKQSTIRNEKTVANSIVFSFPQIETYQKQEETSGLKNKNPTTDESTTKNSWDRNYLTEISWDIYPINESRNSGNIKQYSIYPSIDFTEIKNKAPISFKTPKSTITFNVLTRELPTLSTVEKTSLESGKSYRITGLNKTSTLRQVLDITVTTHGDAVGSIEDGEELYIFRVPKYGEGEGRLLVAPQAKKNTLW